MNSDVGTTISILGKLERIGLMGRGGVLSETFPAGGGRGVSWRHGEKRRKHVVRN